MSKVCVLPVGDGGSEEGLLLQSGGGGGIRVLASSSSSLWEAPAAPGVEQGQGVFSF